MTESGAKFNKERTSRYVLWRRWGQGERYAMCIGLNPSTANEIQDDKTIKFLVRLLSERGYDGFRMCNLYTDVTSKPSELPADKSDTDIIELLSNAQDVTDVIFCWGTFKEAQIRSYDVVTLFPKAKCLGINADKSPKHPAWFVRNGFLGRSLESIQITPFSKT